MSEPSNSPGLWLLSDQVSAILHWFENPESNVWAATCCRRHGLPPDMAGDIHSDSWVKVRTALARRTESFPHLHDVSSAHRYAARSMQRTAIDITRAVRRVESRFQVMDDQLHDPAVFEEMRKVDDSVMIERWRSAVISHARQDLHCSGCPNDVVFAAALRSQTWCTKPCGKLTTIFQKSAQMRQGNEKADARVASWKCCVTQQSQQESPDACAHLIPSINSFHRSNFPGPKRN